MTDNPKEVEMIRKFFKRLRKSESGQSATEYMLIIAVVVLGLLAAASKLIPFFERGVDELGGRIETKYLANDPNYETVDIDD